MSKIRFIGLDVHADTIAASVAEPDGEVRPLGIIPNRLESVRKPVQKPGQTDEPRACLELAARSFPFAGAGQSRRAAIAPNPRGYPVAPYQK